MKIIVQKFGGSSLANTTGREQAVKKIKEAIEKGYRPVVVVSAMGRKGSPYATDTLIAFAKKVHFEIEPRELDLLLSCGEVISAVIFGQTLNKHGFKPIALTGAQAGIITDENFGETRIIEVNPSRILKELKNGKIPVVAGFQGISKSGEITTLGRGGSDTTATALGAALKAEYIEIFTDVDGVMTADPRIVPTAKTIKKASYEDVCEMAHGGAKVIHPRAAEIARRERIPVRVRSTFTDNDGTLIKEMGFEDGVVEIKGDRPVTGIATRNNIIFFKIIPRLQLENATGLGAFKVIADQGISVDFINVKPDSISFIVDAPCADKVRQVLDAWDYKYEISNEYCKITLIGGGMTGRPGVMAKIVEALASEAIPIFQSTDSRSTISVLIKERDQVRAMRALHRAFQLDQE
ncbi:aspartate kinase [Anoxybacter fermentans]|uniref:Aspartokinase n=1 Tax=Anoxybacter fermentans TaxID=1323375 RepID=A0A3S9SVW7_9FIRM|nr:aspartate kinase [Anoxybacter fermentans]AZR72418.1 aspartate kinase [Anoxybacter fermentans]